MKKNNFNDINVISCLSGNPAENKVLSTAGSSGSADAAPSMTESGRSMVEMLGVLAVMGVLSVAGIAGYNSAMNKHRANELLNEASKRATVVAMQVASGKSGGQLSVAEFGNDNWGVTDKNLVGQFALTISGIDKAVCQNILNTIGTGSLVRRLTLATNTASAITTCGQDGTNYALVFNNDLSRVDSRETQNALKCLAGGEYDAASDSCKCADGTGSCCNTGKAVCPDYDSETDTCYADYLCCESGKVTWENGDYKCFSECTEREIEWIQMPGDHHCISCPVGQVPYCDGESKTDENNGLNNCIDEAACCDAEVNRVEKRNGNYDWYCCNGELVDTGNDYGFICCPKGAGPTNPEYNPICGPECSSGTVPTCMDWGDNPITDCWDIQCCASGKVTYNAERQITECFTGCSEGEVESFDAYDWHCCPVGTSWNLKKLTCE